MLHLQHSVLVQLVVAGDLRRQEDVVVVEDDGCSCSETHWQAAAGLLRGEQVDGVVELDLVECFELALRLVVGVDVPLG